MSAICGITSPYKSGPQNHLLLKTSKLNGNFNGLYLRNETDMHNRISALQTIKGLPHRLKMSWTLVHKRHKIGPLFYPPSVSSAFYFIDRLRRRGSANGTQPNFARRSTVNRANNLPKKSWGHPSPKIGGEKTLHLFGFSTIWRLNGEYLLNETWYRQSGKCIRKYEEFPTSSENGVNFGPQSV